MRSKIRSGVSGVSRIFTPNGLNASSTALHSAGGGPSMPVSPAPFAPNGVNGLGVTMCSNANSGTSSADGKR